MRLLFLCVWSHSTLSKFQKTAVAKYIRRHNETGYIHTLPRSGRPRIYDIIQRQEIINTVLQHPFCTATEIARVGGMHRGTVTHILNNCAIRHRIPAKKALLQDSHKAARLRFCQDHENFDWKKGIFSYEKSFCSSSDIRKHLWRPDNTRYATQNIQTTQFSGRVSASMWGWIWCHGPGELAPIYGKFNQRQYIEILEDVFLPSLNTLMPDWETEGLYFMQDNSPIHKGRIVKEWFNSHPEIRLLEWPALSPDLNPIENVWAEMAKSWRDVANRNVSNVVERAISMWNGMIGIEDYFESLYNSMPSRINSVIENNGAYTRY